MNRSKTHLYAGFVVIVLMLLVGVVSASDQNPIGGSTGQDGRYIGEVNSLSRIVSEYGLISLSLDAMGTTSSSGTIQVKKPTGATVRKAYLMSATTGFTNAKLTTGDVKILGNNVVWEKEFPTSISSYNYWSDVTAIVKSNIDKAAAGIVNISITESKSNLIDGEILAVIFDDPSQETSNTVLLHFGAQNVNGDSFTIDLGTAINKADPKLILDYSLGISYGCQGACGSGPVQYSRIDVNGQRLTTSAGGQDDGQLSNGALITVGGIGDTNVNPSNPYATPVNMRDDDELYDLKPFVKTGDTSIKIDTFNPSNDDNILFAAVLLGATRSVGTIDIDISLYNNPTTSAERAPYESIIRYFADGVYESSNGARKLGRVTIHPNNTNAKTADIVWVEECHPNANVAGFGTNGLHINMCDIFEDGSGAGKDFNFLSNDLSHKGGGYTLAHEWGHYYFGLYDEYVGDWTYNLIFAHPHSTDKAVTNSIMNSQWSASSGNYNWLNFSIDKNDTKKTAQYRVYEASGWATLIRPASDDPRGWRRWSLPHRIYYSDLKDVAPVGDNDSPIELPGTARSSLGIVWPAAAASSTLNTSAEMAYEAQLSSILGQNISYPTPILLLAFVHTDKPIADLGVEGWAEMPNGQIASVSFADNGVAPDALADDGLYSAILGYQTNGLYTIEVAFNNDAGLASFVSTSFQPTTDIHGNPVPIMPPVPISDPINVVQTLQVVVSNVQADDYGNTPSTAQGVIANNEPVNGKIDYAGDKDVFVVKTVASGITYVRVSNLAMGIAPRLKVYGEDGTTVLFEVSPEDFAERYPNIALNGVPASTQVYVEVTDSSNTAFGGLYEFSAGERLASDSPSSFELYMPSLIR